MEFVTWPLSPDRRWTTKTRFCCPSLFPTLGQRPISSLVVGTPQLETPCNMDAEGLGCLGWLVLAGAWCVAQDCLRDDSASAIIARRHCRSCRARAGQIRPGETLVAVDWCTRIVQAAHARDVRDTSTPRGHVGPASEESRN